MAKEPRQPRLTRLAQGSRHTGQAQVPSTLTGKGGRAGGAIGNAAGQRGVNLRLERRGTPQQNKKQIRSGVCRATPTTLDLGEAAVPLDTQSGRHAHHLNNITDLGAETTVVTGAARTAT